jgi:hypothetical protein
LDAFGTELQEDEGIDDGDKNDDEDQTRGCEQAQEQAQAR